MKAIILVSGGLDSATTLAIAVDQGYQCHALSFNYGQRHNAELTASKKIIHSLGISSHKIIRLDLSQIGGSALTDDNINIPEAPTKGIPATYVPARNTIFLAYALAYAEVTDIRHIFIGVNAIDYSGYPDCRPEYIKAFQAMAALATKAAINGQPPTIHTPLLTLNKADIIRCGRRLGIDYALTVSCYQAKDNGSACGHCDACRFRKKGFQEAGIEDPTLYH